MDFKKILFIILLCILKVSCQRYDDIDMSFPCTASELLDENGNCIRVSKDSYVFPCLPGQVLDENQSCFSTNNGSDMRVDRPDMNTNHPDMDTNHPDMDTNHPDMDTNHIDMSISNQFPCEANQAVDDNGNCIVLPSQINSSRPCTHVDEILCDDICTDIQVDVNHCGACDRICPMNQICYQGNCEIECAGEVCIENQQALCVDINANDKHCGGCDIKCAQFDHTISVCREATCQFECEAGFGDCDQIYTNGCETDTISNIQNCGTCGNRCPNDANCLQGSCICPENQVVCNNDCVNLNQNINHCGMCNHACPASASCQSGQCVCPQGETLCGNRCVDLSNDRLNCGQCDNICEQTFCSENRCVDIIDLASAYDANPYTCMLLSNGQVMCKTNNEDLSDHNFTIIPFSDQVHTIKNCGTNICATLVNHSIESFNPGSEYRAGNIITAAYDTLDILPISMSFNIYTAAIRTTCFLSSNQIINCYYLRDSTSKKIVLPEIRTNYIFNALDFVSPGLLTQKICFQDDSILTQNHCIDFSLYNSGRDIIFAGTTIRNDLNFRILKSDLNYASDFHCLIAENNILKCIGDNEYKQLGDPSRAANSDSLTYIDIPNNLGITDTAASLDGNSVLALLSNDQLYVWGLNDQGQLGMGMRGTNFDFPIAQGANIEYKLIKAFDQKKFIGITNDNKILVWGVDSNSPVQHFKNALNAVLPIRQQIYNISQDGIYENHFSGITPLHNNLNFLPKSNGTQREMIYQIQSSGNGVVNVQVIGSVSSKLFNDQNIEITSTNRNNTNIFNPTAFEAGRTYYLKLNCGLSLSNHCPFSIEVQGLAPAECIDNSNCNADQKCLGGVCSPANKCFTNRDCHENETCENRSCSPIPMAEDLCDMQCSTRSTRLGIMNNYEVCMKSTLRTINGNTSVTLSSQQRVLLTLNQASSVNISASNSFRLQSNKCTNKTTINQNGSTYFLAPGSYYIDSTSNNNTLNFTITALLASNQGNCTNTCRFANDSECDDGGLNSITSSCGYGTDCADCGRR